MVGPNVSSVPRGFLCIGSRPMLMRNVAGLCIWTIIILLAYVDKCCWTIIMLMHSVDDRVEL